MADPNTPATEAQSRKLPWFRIHTEARNDAKLEVLTDAQHRVWFRLMCLAAEQTEQRGTIRNMDEELLAVYVARGDLDLLRETIKRLVMLRIVSVEPACVGFINWTKRQYTNPSDLPENANARKTKSRGKPDDVTTDDGPSHDTDPTLSRVSHDLVTSESRVSHDSVTAPEYRVQSTDNRTQIVEPTTQTTEDDSVAIATGASAVDYDEFANFDEPQDAVLLPERVTEPNATYATLDAIAMAVSGKPADKVWKKPERGRFCGVVARMLLTYPQADIVTCAGWLHSNEFYQRTGIDPMTLEKQMARWSAAGKPKTFTAPSRTSSRRVMTPEELAMEAEYTYDD